MFPRYLEVAIHVARLNPEPKWKLAAVAVRGGRVLSVGMNCFQQNDSPTGTIHYSDLGRHAETEALRKAKTVPRTIYVARVSKSGKISLSRPCEKCYNALSKAGVKTIYYTIDDKRFGVEKIRS